MGLRSGSGYHPGMNHRMLCCVVPLLLLGCGGDETESVDRDERTSFVDTAPPAATDAAPRQQTARDRAPTCPDRSDPPSADSPIDERDLFDLAGPVRRVEERHAGYTLSRDGTYEQDPMEVHRVLRFDEHGQLVSCRTNLGPGRIDRDEQGRLVMLCLPVGTEALRQTELRTYNRQGRLEEQWAFDASGAPMSQMLAVYDEQGRLQRNRTLHWGIMDSMILSHWSYDPQGRVAEIARTNERGEAINTTSFTYNLGSRDAARMQIRGPDGRRMESTDLALDAQGNWTSRLRKTYRKDSGDNWQERQESKRERTIEYFDDGVSTASSGDEDD